MPVFTRKDSNIVARGLLFEIPLIASEEDVRKEITSVLKSSFSYVTSEDFEFIEVNGKKSSVPLCKEGQEFTEMW